MILLIVLVSLLLAGILVIKIVDNDNSIISTAFGYIPLLFSLTCLLLILVISPINYYEYRAEIAEFKSIQASVDTARAHGEKIENAAIQQEIIKENAWLSKILYYKSTMWSLWVPNEVKQLKPIK